MGREGKGGGLLEVLWGFLVVVVVVVVVDDASVEWMDGVEVGVGGWVGDICM